MAPKVERECQARAHEEAPTVADPVRQRIDAVERTQVFLEMKRKAGDSEWIFAGDRQSDISANFGRLGAAPKQATRVAFSFHDLRATCATGTGRLGRAAARRRASAGPSGRARHAQREPSHEHRRQFRASAESATGGCTQPIIGYARASSADDRLVAPRRTVTAR
jgi:hypothetical protein